MTERQFKGDSLVCFADNYVVIDIETTGFIPSSCEIIELAALRVRKNQIVNRFSSLVCADTFIPERIFELTGISFEMLQNAPKIDEVLPDFLNFIGDDIIVGHNVNFDINFLYDDYLRLCGKYLNNNFIDTLRLSSAYVNNVPDYKLSTLAYHFSIDCEGAHRALKDCEITNELFNVLKRISKDVPNKDVTYNPPPKKQLPKTEDELLLTFYNKLNNTNKNKVREYIIKLLKLDNSEDNLPRKPSYLPHPEKKVDVSSLKPENTAFDETHKFYSKVCVFTGNLQRMTREEAAQVVVNFGGKFGASVTKTTDFLVISNDTMNNFTEKRKKAERYIAQGSSIQIISEDDFYKIIGLDN